MKHFSRELYVYEAVRIFQNFHLTIEKEQISSLVPTGKGKKYAIKEHGLEITSKTKLVFREFIRQDFDLHSRRNQWR